ncbi:RnfABCDGE type electron transport complex subunit D [Fusibacter sp. JL216-2]|uniref:RnfABCDGE type electron transport complex subunit D n=1 Tax=Fusibacter sp. JL216-2 TaxID=3071453 RepID=UPI003D34A2B8
MKIGPIKFMKQDLMRRVIYALLPIILASVYYFGWRVIPLIISTSFFAVLAEWSFKRSTGKPVSEAVFVTSILFVLTLPPKTPYWVAAVGIVFGIIFGKEVFGGFGRNVFNPALVGRAFVYVSFPKFLTIEWVAPIRDSVFGGFTRYIGPTIDAVSNATPLMTFRNTGEVMAYENMLFGNISGSLGETSALLIILAGCYLIYTKTAHKESTFGVLIGFVITSLAFNFLNVKEVPNPVFGLLSGGILFSAVFMATDPISSPKTKEGRWIYGLMIGTLTVIIRGFALFSGGVMFAILISNSFGPLLDEMVKALKAHKKNKQASVKGGTANG